MRAFWLTLAGVSLGAGALGIVLPLLPTTPFVLVAAYAAAKGSPRLHAWILRHRAFGPVVRDWQSGGTVARRTKLVALATMAVSAIVLPLVAPFGSPPRRSARWRWSARGSGGAPSRRRSAPAPADGQPRAPASAARVRPPGRMR